MALDMDRFKESLVYEARAPASEIVPDLEKIRQMDAETEASLTQWLLVMVAGIVVTVASGVGAVLTGLAVVFAPLALIGLGAAIFAVVQRWRLWAFDVQNRRYELVEALLNLLASDMRRDEPFELRLDLRTPEDSSKYTHEGYEGPWTVKYYVDPWLRLKGRLMDGTTFLLEATEKYQSRGKWGGRRGNKWKTKNRSATDLLLELRPKPEKYALLSTVTGDMMGAVRLPGWCQLKILNSQDNSLVLRTGTKAEWDVPPKSADPAAVASIPYSGVDMTAMMFLSLYQVLNLARALQKSQRGGES